MKIKPRDLVNQKIKRLSKSWGSILKTVAVCWLVVFIINNVSFSFFFDTSEKVHIGDYDLTYIGKFISTPYTEDTLSERASGKVHYLAFKIRGTNDISTPIIMKVTSSMYNNTFSDDIWYGKASVYEEDDESREPYIDLNGQMYKVEKYSSAKINKGYIGGTWLDPTYDPISVTK